VWRVGAETAAMDPHPALGQHLQHPVALR
jgi:hypothetical protein